jgi:cardiolipin synthase A/B
VSSWLAPWGGTFGIFDDSSIWAWLIFASDWIIRLVMCVVVPVRRPPGAARSWLLLILFAPWVGLGLFWLVGSHKLPRWRREMLARLPKAFIPVRDRLAVHPNIARPQLAPELEQAVRLAQNLGQLPILEGNAAELLGNYNDNIDRLVADIDAATNHVHLLYYIFTADKTARKVIDAVIRAAGRGIRCRVMVDSLGSRKWLSTLYAELVPAGVHLEESLPVGFWRFLRWRTARIDLRNHRKIAVIDGLIGYTGSQNIVDARYAEGLTYDELVVRVTGPAVLELQFVFASDWFVETEEVLDSSDIFPDPVRAGPNAAQALPSGPGQPTENNQRLFVALIHGARERIVITTPYFIPDEPLLQAMQTAVLRGVEVHLIVSRRADQLLVALAQRSYYEEMLDYGIHIHLYQPRFLHAKHMSVDDQIALIGSSNMDIRSFQLNNEISLIFYGTDVASRLRLEEERYLRKCKQLDATRWARRRLAAKIAEQIARLLDPLL